MVLEKTFESPLDCKEIQPIYMADGVIEEMGTPAAVFENPQSEKTKAFLRGAQNMF